MRIVIVSTNCYPYMGPRAHRTTELAKELAKRGYSVTLYALLGDYDYTEISNRTGIKFKSLGASKFGIVDNVGYRNKNLFFRAFAKLFGKYFAFPLIELTALTKKVLNKEERVDLLITIAHPHQIHWAIPSLKKTNYKTWIADCGDPFMGNPFHKHPFYFKYVEKKWCQKADYITVPIEEAKDAYYLEFRDKIRVIPQGFNFDKVRLAEYDKNDIPTFAYSGIIYEGKRDPSKFMEFLTTLTYDFRFVVYTKSQHFFEKYKLILEDKLEIRDYIPRQELLFELSKMDFLLNIKNDSGVQQPSKLIDYYLTHRPILEISSSFSERNDFESFINADYRSQLKIEHPEKYNIRLVADQFLSLLKL